MIQERGAVREKRRQSTGDDDLSVCSKLGAGALDHALEHCQVPGDDPGAQLVGGVAANDGLRHIELDVEQLRGIAGQCLQRGGNAGGDGSALVRAIAADNVERRRGAKVDNDGRDLRSGGTRPRSRRYGRRPVVLGSSTSRSSPTSRSPVTITGSMRSRVRVMSTSQVVTLGTTLEMIAPSTSERSWPSEARSAASMANHSSGMRSRSVESRYALVSSPDVAKSPNVVFELPTSTARSMTTLG